MTGSCIQSAPGRPRIVKVIGNEVTISWTSDRGGAEVTGYCIAYTTVDGFMAKHARVEATTTAKLNKELIHGQSYVFAVAAKNAFGFGDFSHLSQEVQIPSETGNSLRSYPANFKRC